MKRPARRAADFEHMLADLSNSSAPDMSRSIMGRLGYMRTHPAVARRRAIIKWANRAGMLAVAAITFSLSWRVFQVSPDVRRPIEATIPQAIGREVEVQQHRLGNMIQTIRSFSMPQGEASPPAEDSEPNPQDLRDDVNRTDAAPVRWV